jgi:putative transposase
MARQARHHKGRQRPGIHQWQAAEWAEKRGITIQHIQPGQPQQNAYIERYNRTVRHEWLDQYIIETIEEAQDFATQWLWTYNNDRPNMGIGGITPAQKLKMAA